MKDFFDLILDASLSGSVIILMILLLRLVLSKAPRRYICLLWLLAGLRLLVPIQIESPLSLQPEVPPIVNSQVQTPDPTPDRIPEADPAPMVPADPGDLPGDVDVVVGDDPGGNLVVTPPDRPSMEIPEGSGTVVTPGDSTVTVTPGADPVIQVKPAFDWAAVLPWVWVLGAGAMGLYTLISYLRLKHRVREAVLVDRNVYETAAIDSPFLLGYLRPRIYLPVGLAPQDLDHILAHEQTHLRRGDHWSKLLGFVCLSVHWFNPLVWMAYVMLCKDIEMACDESVVRNMSTGQRKAYSTALVNCAADHRSLSACPLAFGEVSVKSRILNVLNYRKPSFWISLVCVVAIVFTLVCLMTDPVTQENAFIQQCTDALAKWQEAEDYYVGIITQSEIGEESNFFQTLYWKLGDDYVTMHYAPEADRSTRDQSFLYKDGKLYQGWSLTDPSLYPTGYSENMFMGWKPVEAVDGAIHAGSPEQNWPMCGENSCYEYRSYTFLEKTEDGSYYLITLKAEGIYRPYVGGPEYEKTFLLTFTFDSGNQLVSVSQEATDLPLTFNGREEVTVDRQILTASLFYGEDSKDYSSRVINGAYEVATFDGAAWLRQLQAQDIYSITFSQEALSATYTESDRTEMAQAISLLNGFTGEIRGNNCWFGQISFTDYILVSMADGATHSIVLHDGHVSIDGVCYDVRQEWLDAWPTRGQLQRDMVQWCIVSMNTIHTQQKIYLQTWQQAAPNPGRTLRVKVGSNWLIQDVENDIASIWLSYDGQQFSGTKNVQQDGSALVQGSFDKAFSLPWPMDGSLKAQDWEYVESFTEADNTLVVFLRQKSDGALLRLSFADQRHLTGYILTDSNGIVTDGVLSDPDGITPEEHLRAAYQSATATGVALPDYKGRELTQEELDYFAELFQWNPQDPTTFRYNYVLASTFTTAENCNMKYFFYDGLGYERDDPITDEEIQYLQDNGYDYWKGETHRLPADRVEQLLMDYFGLTPDQAWFTLPYNPNTDCYYIFHTDTLGQITQKFSKGYYDVLTGITTLYYPGYSFSPGHIVTLKDQPGNEAVPYRVLSHLFAAERELPHNSISSVNQWQDAEHYWIRSIADYRDVNDQDLRQVVTDFLESLAYRYHYVSTFDYGTNVSQTVSTIRNLNEQYRKYSLPRIITEEAEDYGWKQTDGDLIHDDWFFTVDWDTIPLSYMESMEESYYVIHYYRVSASEIVGFRHSQTTGQLDAVIRIQAILENGETVYATTTYTMESQNSNNIKTALQEIYTKAYALVHDPDGYFRELFPRKTDGAYAEAWIAELYDAFYTDPAEFLTQLASSTLSNREQSDLIDHMSAWADGYDLVYLSDLLRKLQSDTALFMPARDLAYQFMEDIAARFDYYTFKVQNDQKVISTNTLTRETTVCYTADAVLDSAAIDGVLYILAEEEDHLCLYRFIADSGEPELLHTENMPEVPRSWIQFYLPEGETDTVCWETINPVFWQRYLAEQENPDSILFRPGIQNATPDYVEANPFQEGVMYAFFAVQGEINLRPRMWCEYDLSTGTYTRLYGVYDKCFFGSGVHEDSEHFAPYQEVTPE